MVLSFPCSSGWNLFPKGCDYKRKLPRLLYEVIDQTQGFVYSRLALYQLSHIGDSFHPLHVLETVVGSVLSLESSFHHRPDQGYDK